jgi:hypothetical protein
MEHQGASHGQATDRRTDAIGLLQIGQPRGTSVSIPSTALPSGVLSNFGSCTTASLYVPITATTAPFSAFRTNRAPVRTSRAAPARLECLARGMAAPKLKARPFPPTDHVSKPVSQAVSLRDVPQARLARTGVDVRRVRQAIVTACQSLAKFPETDDIRRLVIQAASLSAEVDEWLLSPPSAEACDHVMRCVMAIHIGTVQVARAARTGHAGIGKA